MYVIAVTLKVERMFDCDSGFENEANPGNHSRLEYFNVT
jgi:hypothetical protein